MYRDRSPKLVETIARMHATERLGKRVLVHNLKSQCMQWPIRLDLAWPAGSTLGPRSGVKLWHLYEKGRASMVDVGCEKTLTRFKARQLG